jgi:hypothetical protein
MRARLGLVAVLAAALATGCAGYRLAGRGGVSSFIPEGVRTIGVPQFGNRTSQPQLDQRISEALINEFVRRGRYQVLPESRGADVVLEGIIESYRTAPVTFSESGRYDRVEVTVTAQIRLVQMSPEKVLWAQNHYVFRGQYDLPQTQTAPGSLKVVVDQEIVAIDEIALDFAQSVVTTILEGM